MMHADVIGLADQWMPVGWYWTTRTDYAQFRTECELVLPPSSQRLVSVVIPTHKRPDAIGASLRSVLRQTVSDLEVWVVDDNPEGSDDQVSTKAAVSEPGDHRVRYAINRAGSGASAARNEGLRLARGRYVAFLDDDDSWHPDKLRAQLELFEGASPHPVLVYCGWEVVDDQQEVIGTHRPTLRGDVLEALALNRIGPTSTVLCRMDVARTSGGFDESLKTRNDVDFYIRMAQQGHFDFVDEILVCYRSHRDSLSGDFEARLAGLEAFMLKHQRLFEAAPTRLSELREREGELRLEVGDLRGARRAYWAALVVDPRRRAPYAKLCATLGGRGTYRALRHVYRRLRGE